MLKPTVHYTKVFYVSVNDHAVLTPKDHPSLSVSNEGPAMTSLVLSYDEETGRIETMNTIYMPYKETNTT